MQGEAKPAVQRRNRWIVYVGTTLWIAWCAQVFALAPTSSILVAHPEQPWIQPALVVGCEVGALLLLLWDRFLFARFRLFFVVLGMALSCAVLGSVYFGALWPGAALAPLFLVALGAVMLAITVLWMSIVCVRSSRNLYASMGATMACGLAGGFGLHCLGSGSANVALSLGVMVVSLGCLALATDSTLGADTMLVPHGDLSGRGDTATVPGQAMVAGALIWAVFGAAVALCTDSASTAPPFPTGWMVAGMALAAIVFAIVGSYYGKADKLGLIVLGLMTALFGSGLYMRQAEAVFGGPLMGALLGAGFILYHLYCKVLSLDISFTTASSPLLVFAQTAAANYGGALAGALVVSLLVHPTADDAVVSVIVLVLLLVLVAANATLFSRKNMGTRWGLVSRQACAVSAPSPDGESERAKFGAAAEAVADSAGLTPREAEVFVLVARGRRAKQIEEELGISLGTVRNHINHGYVKLGIHSYDEARNLVEEARASIL